MKLDASSLLPLSIWDLVHIAGFVCNEKLWWKLELLLNGGAGGGGGDYIIFLLHSKDWLFGSRKWDSKIIDSTARARPVCEHIKFIFNSIHSFRKCVMLCWQQTKIKWASNVRTWWSRATASHGLRSITVEHVSNAVIEIQQTHQAHCNWMKWLFRLCAASASTRARKRQLWVQCDVCWCSFEKKHDGDSAQIYISMIHVMSMFYRESSSSSVAIVAVYSRHSHSSAATVI